MNRGGMAQPMSLQSVMPKIKKAVITWFGMQVVTGGLKMLRSNNGTTVDLKTDLTAPRPDGEDPLDHLFDVVPQFPKKEKLPPYDPLWWPLSYVYADVFVKIYSADDGDLRSSYIDPITLDYHVRLDKEFDETKTCYVNVPAGFNGTLMANVTVVRKDGDEQYTSEIVLSRHRPLDLGPKLRNLLESEEEQEKENQDDPKDLVHPFYNPNITLGFVAYSDALPFQDLPPAVVQHFIVDHDKKGYYPVIFRNLFWDLSSQDKDLYFEGESGDSFTVPIHIELKNMKFWMFQLLAGLQPGANGGVSNVQSSELDSMKKVFLETNPYLLALTAVVSMLHMLFEFLAFKNDISHWRNKSDMVGVSVRSIIANVVMQTIILLYLWDNSEDTNFTVLMTQGFGILVEAWKVVKVWNRSEESKSEIEKQTEEYDSIAFKYMYMGGVPLILAYAGYALKYEKQKSWYSFIIKTLVGSVYAYGFLMLVPSIYINYRLKSVAHIPRKAMIYKFLNTFIDDLFAFVIKMPWLHRLATLRDDVIFFIYMYQTWIYRVDYRRVNEFGQGGDADEPKKSKSIKAKAK